MSLDEIKSPLPPRKVRVEVESNVNKMPIDSVNREIKTEVVTEKPVATVMASAKKPWLKWGLIIGGIILVLALIGVLLSKKGGENSKKIVTLNYWGLWEDATTMDGVISDFEAKNPGIKIKYTRNLRNDYRTRLNGRLRKSGSGEVEDVDIFRFHNTWVPMFREHLDAVPNETVTKVGLENDFLEVYKKDLKENGQWLSIPIMYDGLALFYNKDLLEAGKVEVPNNWWALGEAAKQLTVKDAEGKILVSGAALGLANANVDHWSDIVGLMLKQNRVDMTKNLDASQVKIEDALKYYTSFSQSEENVWDKTLPNSTNLFAGGKLAFYFAPSWRVFDLQNLNPDLRYGIAPVPQLAVLGGVTEISDDTQLTDNHWASYWTEGVNKLSKHKKEAWKFLEYLSSPEVLEKLYTAQSQIRSFGEIYPRKSMTEKLKDNQKVWPFVSVADKADTWYLAGETGDDGVNSEMQKYFTDAINNIIRTNGVITTEMITSFKDGIKQIQQKYNLRK